MAEITFTDQNFDKEVLQEKTTPVLVDFWAEWCAPCRIVSPIIEAIAREYAGKIKVGKLNVDQNQTSAQKFGVMSIPTIVIFKSGEVVKTLVGAQNRENYRKEINEVLG